MCSAPNVYMFVYILIGTHMVPLIFNALNELITLIVAQSSWKEATWPYHILYVLYESGELKYSQQQLCPAKEFVVYNALTDGLFFHAKFNLPSSAHSLYGICKNFLSALWRL